MNPLDPAVPAAMDQPPDRVALMIGRHAQPVGDATVDLWERLFHRLAPIIGNDGFDALYERSLHQAATRHPGLLTPAQASGASARFNHLRASLQTLTVDEATELAALLFTTFTSVLSTLIGHPLTTHILRAAWGDAYEHAAQETPPCPTK